MLLPLARKKSHGARSGSTKSLWAPSTSPSLAVAPVARDIAVVDFDADRLLKRLGVG
jgi:hypothetical protein